MDHFLIILNPWAGKGTAGAKRPALEAALREAGVHYTLVTTHARGGATELAWQGIERGVSHVIAVGGDGTINEIVNGIKGAEAQSGRRVPLGIVPIGTGSDFIKVLDGFEAGDIGGAVRRLLSGRTRTIDLGQVHVSSYEPRYFINGLGMGLDAQIAVEAMQITQLKGIAVYFLAIVRALAKYKANPMTVEFDGQQIRRRLLFATAANGRYQGGGFYLTPDANIDDGRLDLCLVKNLRLDEIIRYLPKVLDGTHTQLKQVTMAQAATINVTCNAPIPVATDGEIVATNAREVLVQTVPGALDLVT